ncbi:MAG: tRNA-dihydrouridine synthase family protein [Treponema sp.]|nr:tRNA-dihydrouridine synthase family protein [Treponema sp.]
MPRLICGPMATLSHEAFRRSVERFGGCDEYFTEMINAPSLLNRGPFEQYYLMNGPCPEKIVWQLTGNRAGPLAEAAALVAERGGIGVDINMGCSAPQIYKTGAGIAWMTRPREETREAVRGVKDALAAFPAMRLSVKCRLGDEDFTEEGFFAFTDMLVDEGVQLITLHPRTKKEKCHRLPRYAYVEKLCLRYGGRVQVYLNGGVKDAESLGAALAAAPDTDGVMIARAAAQKPWLFAELKGGVGKDGIPDSPAGGLEGGPTEIDCQQLALDFIADVEACQPPEFYRTRLQRFFAYYCDNFSFGHYFKTKMLNAASPDECRAQVLDYFARQSSDRYRTCS